MAKKKIEVDEDMLKEIMAGDIPIFGREKQKENAPPVASREGWCIVLFMFNRRRLEFYCTSISFHKSLVSEVSALLELDVLLYFKGQFSAGCY